MSDLISRQDAIDAISTWDKFGVDERDRVVRWYEGLEPYVHLRDVVIAIEGLPSAERKGKWLLDKERGATGLYAICSACNELIYITGNFKFCPNCGADMKGEQE